MTRLLPASMFGRLALLLAATLFAVLLIASFALRVISHLPGSEQIGDLIAAQIVAARALERHVHAPVDPADTAPILDLAYADAAPPGAYTPWLPFLRRLAERVQDRLGTGSDVLIEDGEPSRLWVRPDPDSRWIGIAMPSFFAQAAWLSVSVLAFGLVCVLLAAAMFARSLARPLERLARAAPALAMGEVPDPRLGSEGPREVRALAQSLLDTAASVRAAARERELMLAGLSHDLRTPLARLRLALAMQPEGDPQLHAETERNLEELDAIVGQFIDYARDGREEAVHATDLAALANALAQQEWNAGEWDYRGPAALMLRVRPLALRRALQNLIRNARRHGAPPFALAIEDGAEAVTVAIADRGPGIEPSALARLGEPFYRAGTTTPGIGLGLAAVRRTARQHGGDLLLRLREQGGLEARLSLPR